MRKFLTIILLTLLFQTSAYAYTTPERSIPIDISVNGSYIKTDTPAFIDYDTTYVPIRFVSDALGAKSVSWDQAGSTATIVNGNTTIQITENKKEAYINGKKTLLRRSAVIYAQRLYVPVRFVAESFGAEVGWDAVYYAVKIKKDDITVKDTMIDKSYTNDYIFWLGRIIEAESSAEPVRGKIAVGNVILNRVKSADFPNTIYEVIFDTKNGVQFEPVLNGTIYNTPTNESIISAKRALRGEKTVGECLYFLNPRISSNNWITSNRTYYSTINNHDFYL